MSDNLPLKIRVDIRDQWDSAESEIQKSVDNLGQILGHKIVPRVQWLQLYNELKDVYKEKELFIPTISRISQTFYARLLARVDDDANGEWTEQLLEELARRPNSTWALNIEASEGSRPKVGLKPNLGVFMLEIPKSNLPMHPQIEAGFDKDLDKLFSTEAEAEASISLDAKEDEWAEIVHGGETRTSHPTLSSGPIRVVPREEELPAVETLARPINFFKTLTPYVLTVDAREYPIIVQSSHQPSLELLDAYLKKWAKIDPENSAKRPVLTVTPIASAFFVGVIDGLHISPTTSYNRQLSLLNPTMILAFVEGVLGYKETHTTGYKWVFKRETIWK